MNLFILSVINTAVMAVAVLLHYHFLHHITRLSPKITIKHQYKVVFGVAGAMFAHIVEILMFAVCYYLMVVKLGWGHFDGNFEGTFRDCFYFSFTTFTTLGFGDIEPIGDVRYLTGIESLTGLVLITWTASFLYIEMQSFWKTDE